MPLPGPAVHVTYRFTPEEMTTVREAVKSAIGQLQAEFDPSHWHLDSIGQGGQLPYAWYISFTAVIQEVDGVHTQSEDNYEHHGH